jgi:chorismate mutase
MHTANPIEINSSALKKWLSIKNDELIVIGGPCSAETEQQVLQTALEIAKEPKIKVLRAGIWKPRTRPNSFEGIGEKALDWLVQAGKITGLKTATEVANAQHTEACLKAGIDILWIGARSTVNPFTVQEIADAIKGTGIPVLIKNPVNPDLQLWIGAIERIAKSGSDKIAAVHRGFSWFDKTIYRNDPKWEFAIELKRNFPDLAIICDPSHISGKREFIAQVAQKAINLNMDGLMVEVHPTPNEALSDAAQQITPKDFIEILNNLILRTTHCADEEFISQLQQLRNEIDAIDEDIIQKLAARMQIVEKIGLYKFNNNVTILQLKRWEEIIATRLKYGKLTGLSTDFIKEILDAIHKESITIQTEVMHKGGDNRH